MKKILIIIDCLHRGGKERRLVELLKKLSLDSNFKITLVVMSRDVHYKEVFDLNINIKFLIRSKRIDLSIFRKFYLMVGKINPDIVHSCSSLTSLYAFPTTFLKRIYFINAMISTAPDNLYKDKKVWLRSKITFLFSDLIIANSKAGLKSFKANPKKSHFIHNGYDFKRSEAIKPSHSIKMQFNLKKSLIVGMVANFTDNKDYDSYITVAQKILDERNDVQFVAIGDRYNLDKCKKKIKGNYAKNFKFLGKQDDVESIINIFDIAVMLTNKSIHGEGISNSIMEYMAMSKPVIATDSGGSKEIVINNQTGFLIGNKDTKSIYEKIIKLLDDRDLRENFGRNGNLIIRNHFNIKKMVNSYKLLYENVKVL